MLVTPNRFWSRRINRLILLVLNYGHDEHHYGNMVTYMRMKSVVPASSEPR